MTDQVLSEAKRLHDLGWAILWLRPKKKNPVRSGWTTGERESWTGLKKSYRAGYNVGVRTGTPSKIGDYYLACIDVDVKDPGSRRAVEGHLRELVGDRALLEVTSGSGGGSRHLYCLTREPFRMITYVKVEGKYEICIYSDGRQMVIPPSIHPTGRRYEWKRECVPVLMDFSKYMAHPESSNGNGHGHANGMNGKGGKAPVGGKVGSGGDSRPATEGREASVGEGKTAKKKFTFTPADVEIDWLPMPEKTLHGIKDGTEILDRSAFLLPATAALHSAGLSPDEVLSVLTDERYYISTCARDHVQSRDRRRQAEWLWRYTVRRVFEERSAAQVFTSVSSLEEPKKLSPEEVEQQTAEILDDIDWTQKLDRTKQGRTMVSLKNVDLILTNSVEGNVFIKDLFANRILYGIDTPWGGKAGEALQDIDMILVKRWLADTSFGIEPSTNMILEATSLVGHRCRVHPVREYLESLEWDGVKRVDTWIKDYCQGVADEPYLSQVSRKFLLAMVKRVFEPGCQWDYVLVLEGKQGQYKSSIARALASNQWFMDNLPDLKDKDAMLNLQGKWLIELGELTSVKRGDYNLVKAYLVRRTDTVRPHYGRIQADVPRQSVFIGTVNEGQYLKDPTGNRRFWPVKVGMCDVAGLTAVRDQLFAEAMSIYRSTGEILMLDEEANTQATAAQDDRRVEDDETEMRSILEEFMASPEAEEFGIDRFRARDLFDRGPWGRFSDKPYAMQTAAIILTGMGFTRHKIAGQRLWRKPENVEKGWGRPSKSSAPGSAPSAPHFESDFF